MKTETRRHVHVVLAIVFAVQVPIALAAYWVTPDLFEAVWQPYLIFLSLYAIVSTHWAGASAETPTEGDDDADAS